MQHFRQYFKDKLNNLSFRELYEKECHVCRNTLRIFEKMTGENLSIEKMAAVLGADFRSLQLLQDADYCDPELVVRLCRELDLPVPESCP